MDKKWKKEYAKILLDENVSIDEFFEYISRHLPRYLYKYRIFNEYWEDAVFNGVLYASSALALNDPFDCYIYVDVKKFARFMNTFASKYVMPQLSYDEIERLYNDRMKNNLDRCYQQIRKETLVTCFSENYDSILMWSHYADGHKGFCIEYDTQKILSVIKKSLFPVAYRKKVLDFTDSAIMFDYSYINQMKHLETLGIKTEYELKDIRKNAIIPFLIKAKVWKYEQEWRIIFQNNVGADGCYINLENAINSIYLGAYSNLYNENIDKIINWAFNKNIKVYQMQSDIKKYRLTNKEVL